MIKVICNECGTEIVFAVGIKVKMICQQCGSIDLNIPDNIISKEEGKPGERIYILEIDPLAKDLDPIAKDPDPPDSKEDRSSQKTDDPPPVIGDKGNEPPIEKVVKPRVIKRKTTTVKKPVRKPAKRKIIKRKGKSKK